MTMAPQVTKEGAADGVSLPESEDGPQLRENVNNVRKFPLIELTIENLTYSPVTSTAGSKGSEKKRVTVLNKISTKISPYKLTAWMGPSGSGKTSLISVAADLTRSSDIQEGSLISVNGEEGKIPKRLVGVVWQDDLLLSNLTVEENLYFAARLKTPEDTSDAAVRSVVEETMAELGLTHIRESLVGNALGGSVRGISGGERKRVAVGAELVVRPACLLLDEITSGLDSSTAQSLMSTLRDLAKLGHSIAVVIHQPRTAIYNMFDHLLLLSRGNVIYNGHPSKARCYLETFSGELPPETGIADWLMDIVTEDEKRKGGSLMAKQWLECVSTTDCAATTTMTATESAAAAVDVKSLDRRMSSLDELHAAPRYNTRFRTQLKLLTYRTLKQQRGERLTLTAVMLQLVYLFFTALLWWRMPDNTSRVFDRNSLLFFMLIAQANGIVIAAVTVFQRERTLLSRERAKKMYTVSSYFLAKTASDMTNNVLLPLLYSMIVYWTAGYRVSATAYLKYIFTFYWTFSTAQSMGLFLSILIPNPQIALVLAPPITLFFMIMGGFYIPFANMPPGVEWASYLSFARYGYSALM
jgi:ABC-type multidrug transport system ATPase subunit